MKKNIKKLFLAAGLLAMTGALLTGCGSKKKNAEEESVIKISTAPEPTASDGSTDNADSAGEDTSSDEDNDTSGSGGEEGAMDGE